jgi:hypothetical protein
MPSKSHHAGPAIRNQSRASIDPRRASVNAWLISAATKARSPPDARNGLTILPRNLGMFASY